MENDERGPGLGWIGRWHSEEVIFSCDMNGEKEAGWRDQWV